MTTARSTCSSILSTLATGTAATWRIFYERLPIGSAVPGGTGGGLVTEGVRHHPRLEEQGVRPAVEAVIAGERDRID
ncbi:MAG TPA: hypothetical protein VLB81_04170 [Gaiellales bacterium]|nr:hypothetical protein [Gaiellales bacterium]